MSLSSDALPVMAVQPNCTSKDPNLHRIKLGNCIGQSVWTAVLSGSNCTHNVVVKKFHLPKDLPDEVIEDINLLSHYSKLGANLCTVHGCLVSDEGNDLFIVRDYCEESLHEVVVRSRKLTAEQTIRLGICIAKAVTDLHNFDIVCGNIKVSNILLNDNSDAFLSDYGLMKIMKDLGISMPTSDYPAPEIQSNELQNPSKESDMWSFGCTLLEMYTGDRSMIRDVISNLVNGKKTSIDLSIVPEDCPLGNIICQCLQADASSRPSCLDVLRILSRYVLKPKLNNRPRCITREEALSKLMYDLRTYASNDDDTAVRKLLRDVKNIQNLDILLNSKDINGETLLHWSLKMGSMKCVELLLQSGASPQSQDVEGESILHISITRKNTDLAVKIMEKYPDSMGIMNHRNKTPLHLCIETSNTVLVSKWIDITNEDTRKHIIDVRGPAGTALCMAASIEKGQDLEFAFVHQLLKAGADPIITDNNNQSILHLAVMKDDRELAEILLNATQLIEARNGMGRTPLHIALSYTSMSCVRLLMDHGADWQLEDNEGNNAFHIADYAIQCGRVSHFCDEPLSFIRMLPRLAEDNKIKRNYRGNTPLDILMLMPFDFICQEYGDELFSWGLDREICRRVKLRELYHPPPTGASGAKVTLQDKDLSCRLTDAKLAGGNWSLKCTLILTEGESAKMFAMSGICSVLGSNMFGVYALNGKPLNAEDHSKDICNPQLKHIACILGLEFGESNDSNLRYGSVMFMMDPDEDGCHIKGLLLAFFQNLFSLASSTAWVLSGF